LLWKYKRKQNQDNEDFVNEKSNMTVGEFLDAIYDDADSSTYEDYPIVKTILDINTRDLIASVITPGSEEYNSFLASSANELLDNIALFRFIGSVRLGNAVNQTRDTVRPKLIKYCENYVAPGFQYQDDLDNYYATEKKEYENETTRSGFYSGGNNELHNLSIYFYDEIDPVQVKLIATTSSQLMLKSFENTPLCLACKTGHTELGLLLIDAHIEHGVSLNEPDELGMTPLHWACFFRDDALIRQLTESGANTAINNSLGQTAFDIYTKNLPCESLEIATTLNGANEHLFEGISSIQGRDNKFEYSDIVDRNVLNPNAFIDIICYMDKVAFHKLGFTKSALLKELKLDNYSESRKNTAYECFNHRHLRAFIRQRNLERPTYEIMTRLQTTHPKEPDVGIQTEGVFLEPMANATIPIPSTGTAENERVNYTFLFRLLQNIWNMVASILIAIYHASLGNREDPDQEVLSEFRPVR